MTPELIFIIGTTTFLLGGLLGGWLAHLHVRGLVKRLRNEQKIFSEHWYALQTCFLLLGGRSCLPLDKDRGMEEED